MKDKEWLKNEINKVTSRIYGADFNTMKEIDDLIDQLEEPEKPVVPQFVANYYREFQNHELTFEEWYEEPGENQGSRAEKETFEWLFDKDYKTSIERQYILADIIAHGLNGYEVEKEKLYWIVMPTGHIAYRCGDGISYVTEHYKESSDSEKFTEAEIKAIDERLWSFAEEVTE